VGPSGKNNQPWKFAIIRNPSLKEVLANLTHSRSIIQGAPVCIAVFLDHSRVYDKTKDVQAIGACIQNMLLTIHSLGLGGIWLGEILKNKERVAELLGAGKDLELMPLWHWVTPPKNRDMEKETFWTKSFFKKII